MSGSNITGIPLALDTSSDRVARPGIRPPACSNKCLNGWSTTYTSFYVSNLWVTNNRAVQKHVKHTWRESASIIHSLALLTQSLSWRQLGRYAGMLSTSCIAASRVSILWRGLKKSKKQASLHYFTGSKGSVQQQRIKLLVLTVNWTVNVFTFVTKDLQFKWMLFFWTFYFTKILSSMWKTAA